MKKKKIIIAGAAGRDFHNFNVYFRDNDSYEVVAFTATQIPDIEGRLYPPQLAGSLYPEGIPIYAEQSIEELIKEHSVDQVVFSYSDVSHRYVMSMASIVMAAGADFRLMGSKNTMLKSSKPVVAVTAVRTGAGKSQTTRRICDFLKEKGKKVVVVRHPMPYGDLTRQVCQRFANYQDLDLHKCTIEEREEYEPHIERGIVVYAGVDYSKILQEAEREADIIIWDGGNNDTSFYEADVYITIVDPHRPGHELNYHHGEINLRMADCVIINKIETADSSGIQIVRENIAKINPNALVIQAASPMSVEQSELLRGKKVLVIEDGPTLTHGEMPFGAGVIAAKQFGAELVDPRPFAVGSILKAYEKYPHIGNLLPAMGYSEQQIKELKTTINNSDAEMVLIATPIDLGRLLDLKTPAVRLKYELQEIGEPTLENVLAKLL
ncbi:MAG: cyclic 2,3-diphosphoglycerate synthase [Dethiobacteria bacterium]|jgi:predicted GTPase